MYPYFHGHSNFARFIVETVEQSLHHSYGTEINRQAILLPWNHGAAVSLGFNTMKLSQPWLSAKHWAGLGPYTILNTSSQSPVFLLNSRYSLEHNPR